MNENYKTLRAVAFALKILAFIGFAGIFFITIINIFTARGSMGHGNIGYLIFNNLFPIFFAVFQALFLYAFSELILLFIDIKEDLNQIKKT
ncbi:hypothetical protein [Halonatronum saccharophilum]|uniref:hypothetical protein n=1 Tax=Halonatronum saccharophilum TaxID=150060 RepID=UPI000489312E|nr:hypothetical protein [Halonatronum saccharophilum]